MNGNPPRPKLFVSYAHADEHQGEWKSKILPTLRALKTGGVIEFFEDEMIEVGDEWDERLRRELDCYDLIVFLVSTSFLGSGYIHTVEVERALERHNANEARILPILIKPCDWTYREWAKVQAFPRQGPDARALSYWEKTGDLDEALLQISRHVRQWTADWRARQPKPAAVSTLTPTTPPYRGLAAFEPDDEADFFGREGLTETLWTTVGGNRLTLLTGGSGSGKSSLVNAGLIPRLRRQGGWCVARARPLSTPIDNIAHALARALLPGRDTFTITDRAEDLAGKLVEQPARVLAYAETHREQTGQSLFLVIDQFEETFNLSRPANPEQHERLIDLILAIAASPEDGAVKALLAMRADFQAELQNDRRELVKMLQPATVFMYRMEAEELTGVINGPAQRRGVAVEPALLATLVADVRINPDALPLLEATLESLWNDRGDGGLTLAAYQELDGLAGALAERAEAALDDPAIDIELARRLFIELVHVDPQGSIDEVTRQPRTRTHLDRRDARLWPLAEILASAENRLLVISRDETAEVDTLDIVHEALFRRWQRLADWIEAERDLLLFRQRLHERMAEFAANDENPEFYLRRLEVDQAEDWRKNQPDAFTPEQQAFIEASAAYWTEDAADDAARALWGRLELFSRGFQTVQQHDRSAMAELPLADRETRQRFLRIAASDDDAARKFNRKPELILRAVLGLDPAAALDLATPAIDAKSRRSLQTAMIWLSLARHLSPIAPTRPTVIVERALQAIEQTTDPDQLNALAQTINALADKLDTDAATRTVERALQAIEQTTSPRALNALAQTINALADKLDKQRLKDAATRTVERALQAIEQTTSPRALNALAQTINALADKLDKQRLKDAATRTVERALQAIEQTVDPHALNALAQTINALADKLDTDAATRTVERALQAIEQTTSPRALNALAQTINALADKLDKQRLKDAATRTVERALQAIEQTVDPHALNALAQTINALADKLDKQRLKDAATRTVERALQAIEQTTSPRALNALAQTINALADKLDKQRLKDAATRTVERALQAIEQTVGSDQLDALAQTINALADKLDTDAATRTVERALQAIEQTVGSDQLDALAQTINALADKLDKQRLKDAATRTVERALQAIEQTTSPRALNALAQTINALADKLDKQRLKDAATRTVERALQAIEQTTSPRALNALAQTLEAMLRHLPRAVLVLAATETLKQPLGGDQGVTKTLIEAITRALGRPDLLSEFPERSFWAVMQHLAELKAANPDWDWLDLARPPMPTDELIATFRDLCANPPDWPATTAPA